MRTRLALPLLLLCVGCGEGPQPLVAERVAEVHMGLTVEEAVAAGCSTSQVEALSRQIVAQGNCLQPDAYTELATAANVNLGSAVLPFMQAPARDALAAVIEAYPAQPMQINSMLRTVAQQYLLYRWFQLGTCGIGLAASPGNSNHETGLAIDIQQYDSWRDALETVGFAWLGAGDPVHFDYVGPDAVDHSGLDVLAFQQLWNLNNPADLIEDDGIYGPETEDRLVLAPAEGFTIGAECGDPPAPAVTIAAAFVDASDAFSDGPSKGAIDLFEAGDYEVAIDVLNAGDSPASDVSLDVVLPEGDLAADSYTITSDVSGQLSDSDDETLEAAFEVALDEVAPGETKRVTLTVTAARYTASDATPLSLTFAIDGEVAELSADVYSQRRWEWDGGRLEGWSAVGAGSTVAVGDDALHIDAAAGAAATVSPTLSVPCDEVLAISMRMRRSGDGSVPAALYFTTDTGPSRSADQRLLLDVPADGTARDITIDPQTLPTFAGSLTGLRFEGFDGAEIDGTAAVEWLRLEQSPPPPAVSDDGSCDCRQTGRSKGGGSWWLLSAAGLVALRRRQPRW